MAERNGATLINTKLAEGKNVCVGLDTEHDRIPECVLSVYDRRVGRGPRIKMFNAEVIKATKNIVGAYKYNHAFYLAEGQQGIWALEFSVKECKLLAPDVPIILDAKFGDVGISAAQYAKYAFEVLGVDAVTVNPWGGCEDGLDAFFAYQDKMIFVWCRSSNEGARDFQNLDIMGWIGDPEWGRPACSSCLYIEVAKRAAKNWNKFGNCGLIIGATFPRDIKSVRKIGGKDMPILVPGIGAQGGDLEKAVKAAGPRTIFNSSRGIIYASKGLDFAEAARKEVMAMNETIHKAMETSS